MAVFNYMNGAFSKVSVCGIECANVLQLKDGDF